MMVMFLAMESIFIKIFMILLVFAVLSAEGPALGF